MKMASAISYRGPDDCGVWVDAASGVAFGHRRLAIVDLSPEGHQPMHSGDGRFTVAFNGEIYNFRELRDELSALGHRFRGHCDTEVLLAAVSQWGVPAALGRFVGMFAFGVWDRLECCLWLARDRMGEKPLYYGWAGQSFVFASELKAIRSLPGWTGAVNRGALAAFFRFGYVPGPYSIYRGIHKLPPAAFLKVSLSGLNPDVPLEPKPYWSLREVARAGEANPFQGTQGEAVARLDELLRRSVAGQMMGDVPIGAFLSGGVDSSAIVALMQTQSSKPVRTFTIGFHEAEFNEAQHAAAVSKHLGTDHTELYVTPSQAMAVIPRLPEIYDEPFSDSSQIPTFLVSELARRSVTVSLSGDGGDELFAGYPRYAQARLFWSKIRRLPGPVRQAGARLLQAVPLNLWNGGANWMFRAAGRKYLENTLGHRVHLAAEFMEMRTPDALYLYLMSHWKQPEALVFGAGSHAARDCFERNQSDSPDFVQRMCFLDSLTYLPDDILVKVDRASMAVSLESRVPLLDHRVVEFAWQLPAAYKLRGGDSKWILRQLLYKYVPRKLIDRPKMGFGVPIDQWLRGPLRDWAEELLAPARLKNEGFLDPAQVSAKWDEHVSGKRRWHYYLWDVLMFQAWLESQKQQIPVSAAFA